MTFVQPKTYEEAAGLGVPFVELNAGARLSPFQGLQLPVNAPVEQLSPQANQAPSTEGLWSPERIAREREIAQSLMSTDSGPIYNGWQGLAHVLQNVAGGLQTRSANKAEQRGRDYSREIMKELFPSAQGAQGGAGVSAPASAPDLNRLQAVMADPYASPQVKAAAQQQYEMATFREKEQFKAGLKNQEQVWEDNSGNRWRMGANGMPEELPFFIDRTQKYDSQVSRDPITGMERLVRVPLQNPYATPPVTQGGPTVGAVVVDPRKVAAGNVDSGLASMDSSKTITRADLRAVQASLGPNGRAASEKWMRENNIKVVD